MGRLPFIRGVVHFPVAQPDGMTQKSYGEASFFFLAPKLFLFD